MRRFHRTLLVLWLVWHLFVMSVDLVKHITSSTRKAYDDDDVALQIGPFPLLTVGNLESFVALRHYTEWYEKRLAVHQNWPMFAPNPRQSTTWLEVTGEYEDGTRRPIPLAVGRPDPESSIWWYARAGKFERNATSKKRHYLRRGYQRMICGEGMKNGLKWITFDSVTQRTPHPSVRGNQPRSAWSERRVELSRYRCRPPKKGKL